MSQMQYKYRISVAKAVADEYADYEKVFENSAMWKHYFKDSQMFGEMCCKGLEDGTALVAKNEAGDVVGFMIYDLSMSYPCLKLIGVKEAFRGKKIGDQMVDIFCALAKSEGYDRCFTCVADWNPRARSFFTAKLFKSEKLVADLYKEGSSEWLLMKKL